MRISDWSSDVCSSDLPNRKRLKIISDSKVGVKLVTRPIPGFIVTSVDVIHQLEREVGTTPLADVADRNDRFEGPIVAAEVDEFFGFVAAAGSDDVDAGHRSAERRVGQACVGMCRSRGSP